MTAAIASLAYSNNTGATSLPVTAPSGLSAGDLVVLHIDANTSGITWSAPDASWTLVSSNTTVAIFSHVATSSEPATWTFTRTGANSGNKACAIRVTGANVTDTSQIIARASKVTYSFTSMTAAETNELAIYSVISWASQTPWTAPSGVTEANDTADGMVAYEVLTASGATTARSFTGNSNQNSSGIAILIKSSSSSGGGPTNGTIKITYQASNTFTCPANVTSARIQCEGAGGPGGNGGSTARGGGGGGGAYAEEPALTLVPGRTYTVTVPGTASTVGTAGGAAQFVDNVTSTVLVKAAGGSPGANGGLSAGSGGAGGTTANSIGSITTAGATGTSGGAGGNGAPPLGGNGGTTTPGSAPGGGGGGGALLSGAGQAGAQGVVIVTFTYATESVASSDTVQLVVNWKRPQNESMAAVDAIANMVVKPMSDSVGITETPAKLVLKKPNDETVSTSDALTRIISFLRTENLNATDFESMFLQRALAENITVAEAFTKFLQKTYAETLSTSDGVTQYLQKPVTENLTATDLAVVVLQYLRTFNDAVTATDLVAKYLSIPQADAVAVIDEAMKLTIKKFADVGVSVLDSAIVQATYNRFFGDAATSSDSLSKAIRLGVADTISGSVSVAPAGRRIFAILSD